MALTDTALKALKPKDKPYALADERGRYVEVFPTMQMRYAQSTYTFPLCRIIRI
ncbi:MAG: hypothetical protein ACREU8_12970 [Gammaproteobacteria bacterium]